jgi:hypothetical protein
MTTAIVVISVAESSILEHLTRDKCDANERKAMFEMAHFLATRIQPEHRKSSRDF